jgi:hypothetical protein
MSWELSVFLIVDFEHGILERLRDQTNDQVAEGEA